MGIPHKYDNKTCPNCGILIKKGDLVNKVESTGKWCSNDNCPNPPQEGFVAENENSSASKPTKTAPQSSGATDIEKLDFAETAVSRFIAVCLDGGVDAVKVAEQLGAVWNTAMMQKK